MPEPRVTICIPTYRRTRWLERAIASSLAQRDVPFVVEVHDDATPGDAVAEVVARFDDPRLRLIRHAENVGIVGNFTRSLLGARTEYVLQLGDDDEAAPTLLAETVAVLDAQPRTGFVHSRFDLVDADDRVLRTGVDWLGTPARPLEPGEQFIRESMLHGSRVCSSTTLIRRAAAPPDGFRTEDAPPFDFACWLRIAEDWDVAFIARALCRYRIHGQSFTAGLSDLTGQGYLQTEDMLRAVHAVKRRHLAARPPGRERAELERMADGALRRDLVGRVRAQTLPERRLVPTLRGLAGTARRNPSVLREPSLWALLAASLLGRRVVARLRPGSAQRGP